MTNREHAIRTSEGNVREPTENEIAAIIVDAAFEIHSQYGPGLLESVYETMLAEELCLRGLDVLCQHPLPVIYKGRKLNDGFRIDLIVNEKVIVEVKSIEALHDVHFKQTLTYLRLSGRRLGLLINFNEALIKDGIKRVVNRLPD